MLTKHNVRLLTTGGTIGGNTAGMKEDTCTDGEHFVTSLTTTLDSLKKEWGVDVCIKPKEIVNEDSSNITPNHWKLLADEIKQSYDEFDSFIITHGTNTIGYTSAALSFALANLDKPVVLTGSQVPFGGLGSDAQANLSNATRVVVLPKEKRSIKGITAVFGSHIITGPRVKKSTEFDYDALTSFGTGSIGRIGRIIDINEANLKTHLKYLSQGRYEPAKKSSDLICESDFDIRIMSLTEFPGMNADIFETLVEKNDIRGFILRAFGAGDVSTNLLSGLEFLKRKEIPIVVTTQASNGISNFQVNEPGRYLKDHNLAIPAYDMGIEAQTTKLAWLLSKKEKEQINYTTLCNLMQTDMRGEVNVQWETD